MRGRKRGVAKRRRGREREREREREAGLTQSGACVFTGRGAGAHKP